MAKGSQECMAEVDMVIGNIWYRFKKFWYFLIGKEWKVGWVVYEKVGVVILNDEATTKIELTSESDLV